MTGEQANYFLENYPQLSRQARSRREDILNAYRQEAYVSGSRKSGHGDPTANKAVLLADGSDLEQILQTIGIWINSLSPADRLLLIAVWRFSTYGWHCIAKELKREVAYCRHRWTYLTRQLSLHLTACAGSASDRHGTACADSRRKIYRE